MLAAVPCIAFNTDIAKIHGSFIGGRNHQSKEVDVSQIEQVANKILSRLKNDEDEKLERREIFIFLLANTDLPWKEEIIANENVSSFANICGKLLTPAQLIGLVDKLVLWEYMYCCCATISRDVASILLENAFNFLDQKKQETEVEIAPWIVWTGLARASLPFQKLSTAILTKYLGRCLQKAAPEKERMNNLLSVLSVANAFLSGSLEVDPYFAHLFEQGDEAIAFDGNPEIRSSLIVALKAMLFDMDFDQWIQLCEIPSADVMVYNGISKIWQEDDVPSNVQFMAAHLIYKVKSLLQGQASEPLTVDLLPVMDQFAKEYNKVLELDLESIELPQLLEVLEQQKDSLEQWKIKAYLGKLMTFMPGCLEVANCVSVMSVYAEHLHNNFEDIFVHIVQVENRQEMHDELFFTIAQHTAVESLSDIATKITNGEIRTLTVSADQFDSRFVEAMNRSGGEGGVGKMLREFFVLAILNGDRTIERLVEVAMQNAGQLDNVCQILKSVWAVGSKQISDLDIPNKCDTGCPKTLLGSLLAKCILEKVDKELENSIKLFNNLKDENNTLSQQVYSACLPQILKLFDDSQVGSICTLLEVILSCLCVTSVVDTFTEECTTYSINIGCYMLNHSYYKPSHDNMRLNLIKWISAVTRNDSSLIKVRVLPDLMSYFSTANCKTLLDKVHGDMAGITTQESGSKVMPMIKDTEMKSQITACLVFITKEEFAVLFNVLKEMFPCEEEGETNILKCVEMLSDACHKLFVNHNLDEERQRRIVSGYASVYTGEVPGAETETLIKLYSILIKDIFVLKDTLKTPPTDDSEMLTAPLWISCQAVVAELLQQQLPSLDTVKLLLIHLAITPKCSFKEAVIMVITNYLDKSQK